MVDFIAVSSYGKQTVSTGKVRMLKDISIDITGKNVVLVDDIVDSGLTLSYLKEHFQLHEPKSIKVCTMFDKQERLETPTTKVASWLSPVRFLASFSDSIHFCFA